MDFIFILPIDGIKIHIVPHRAVIKIQLDSLLGHITFRHPGMGKGRLKRRLLPDIRLIAGGTDPLYGILLRIVPVSYTHLNSTDFFRTIDLVALVINLANLFA